MSSGLKYCRQGGLLLLFVFSLVIPASSQSIIYVDADAVGSDDGSSWADAFVYPQDGLAVAEAGDEVWVAEGIYRPDQGGGQTSGDRAALFHAADISMYGGFEGVESSISERVDSLRSVLTGDLLDNDSGDVSASEPTRADNAWQVLGLSSALLDGFVVTSAHGNGGLSAGHSTIRNVRVTKNYSNHDGGGVRISGEPCRIENVVLEENVAEDEGGGVIVSCQYARLEDVVLKNNSALQGSGMFNRGHATVLGASFVGNVGEGAIYTEEQTRLLLVNALLSGNSGYVAGVAAEEPKHVSIVNSAIVHSTSTGGAVFVSYGHLEITNSVVAFNDSGSRGAIHEIGNDTFSAMRVSNSIFWGNEGGSNPHFTRLVVDGNPGPFEVAFSLLEGMLPDYVDEVENLYEDPLFSNPLGLDGEAGTEDDDLTVLSASPAIDSGDLTRLPPDSLDLDGDQVTEEYLPVDGLMHRRVYDGGTGHVEVDIGAYEFGAPPVVVGRADSNRLAADNVYMFPNPARSYTTLGQLPFGTGCNDIEMFDLLGRRLERPPCSLISVSEARMELRGIGSGRYFVVLQGGSGRHALRGLLVVSR